MKRLWRTMVMLAVAYACCAVWQGSLAYGGEMSNDMKKMQEQLNNQVMSKPFSVADEAQVKSYIDAAQKRGEVPAPYTGTHWRPGYTCANLRGYSYQEYLSCRYYYSYYGHYYPYYP